MDDVLDEQPSLGDLIEMRTTAAIARSAADQLIGHLDALIALVVEAQSSTVP